MAEATKRWKVTVSRDTKSSFALGSTVVEAKDEDEAKQLAMEACPGWDIGWIRPASRYDH